MITIDNSKEVFLKLSLENNLTALNNLVTSYFDLEFFDLSFGETITFRNSNENITNIINSSIGLISEIRVFDEVLADAYLEKLKLLKLLIDSISNFNDELIQIEDLALRHKKFFTQLFEIYNIVIRLFEVNQQEVGVKLLQRLREFQLNLGQQPFLREEGDFNYKTLRLLYTLLGISLKQIYIEEIFMINDIEGWLNEIDDLSSIISLDAKFALNKFLKLILGRQIDSEKIDSDQETFYKCYRYLVSLIKEDGDILENRSVFEKGILKLGLLTSEDKVHRLEYTFFKNIYQNILNLIEVDLDWLLDQREELMNYLIFAKNKYENESSSSKRNQKKINYLNNILDLLNEI